MNTDKPFFLLATKMMLSVLMDSPNNPPQMGWETAPRGMKNVQNMMTQGLRTCEPCSAKNMWTKFTQKHTEFQCSFVSYFYA